MIPGASAEVNTGFDPGSTLSACPELHKPDFFSIEILDRLAARSGDNHVISIGEIVEDDTYRRFAGGSGDERVAIGHADGVDLAGDVGIHGRHIVEPHEFDIDASFFEPAFLDADFPSNPAGPIGIGDLEGLCVGKPAKGEEADGRGSESWNDFHRRSGM